MKIVPEPLYSNTILYPECTRHAVHYLTEDRLGRNHPPVFGIITTVKDGLKSQQVYLDKHSVESIISLYEEYNK